MFAAAAVLGMAVIVIFWWFGYARAAPRPLAQPPPTNHVLRPSEEEVQQQQQRNHEVKQHCLETARQLKGAIEDDNVEDLSTALGRLSAVADTLGDGPTGVMAMTELCNALLDADALETLNGLQQHADSAIASEATKLFSTVVPRIWSF